MSNLICYDSQGKYLKRLYQWDINQTITVTGIANIPTPIFHFTKGTDEEALVVNPSIPSGSTDSVRVSIPNILLQTSGTLYVYMVELTDSDGDTDYEGIKTTHLIKVPVVARPQPADYEYEENIDYESVATLNARLSTLIAGLSNSSSSSAAAEVIDMRNPNSGAAYTTAGDYIRDIDARLIAAEAAISNKADASDVEAALATKADASDVETALGILNSLDKEIVQFTTRADANAYLETEDAAAGQVALVSETASDKFKLFIIEEDSSNNLYYQQASASCYINDALPSVANGDADIDYYIGTAANGYVHYRFINGSYIAVGGDSYGKNETYSKNEVDNIIANSGFMKLADASISGIRVPESNSAPDTTSSAYTTLNVGQVFVCVIDEKMTYWIKQSNSDCVNISKSGLEFDGGRMDDEGYLHLTIGGVDISGFEPFYVGTGGSGSGAGINLTNVVKPTSVRNGANAVFSFTATETSDQDITVKWYVDNILVETQPDRASGSSFSFNAKNYLKPSDTSTVKAVITSVGGASLNRQWNIISTAFSLAWGATISPVTLYTANESVYVVVKVSAQATSENEVTLSINEYSTTKTVTGSRDITFELAPDKFTAGINTITASMVSSADENDEADPINYKAIWGYGVSSPVVAFADSSLSVSQYDVASINYFVYDPDNEIASCTVQVGSDSARSFNASRTMQTMEYTPQDYGSKTVVLTCGSVSTTMTLNISQSEYNIGMVTGDNLRYNLDPTGRSNSDADRESFGNLSFSPGFDWVNGGFKTDADGAPAFVVKKGHSVTLPSQLFGDADGNGKTVDISFCVKNSDQYDAVAMQELNNGGSKGLILRANEGELRLNNTTGQLFRYCENSRIDMSINVEELNDQRVMTVWLDGIPSLANQYAAGTLVQTENALVIGSAHCDVWVYAIHIYNSSLSYKEMIQNYISLAPTTAIKVARCQKNDIYDANDKITPTSLHNSNPDLTIINISAERLSTGKDDADYVDAEITIRDGSTLLTLDSGARFKDQGTSSMAYGRAAYNMDIEFASSGKTYRLSNDSIPVTYLNIKVNVASSECANNVNGADWYNTYQPYLVPARELPGVRDTIEGKPCAVFFTNTSDNTIWAGSQQVSPGETILYAMGDLCNSKKNTDVFGQNDTYEHYAKGCIEVSGNDTMAQQFRATSTYNPSAKSGKGAWQTVSGSTTSTDYEWRVRPKSTDVTEVVNAWDAAVAWVVSTNVAGATNEALNESVIYDGTTYTTDSAAYRLAKFKAEVGNYFAIDSLKYHFLYLEFFAAFDNVSKNTFYSYEWDSTANKYLFNVCKNYDDDTILGCDNDGVPLADYGADFGDTAGGRSLFNADGNTIYVNIRDGFQTDLATMYLTLRGKGAFNPVDIINKWDNYQAIRPHAAMAVDAYNKYILPYKTTGVIVGGETKSYDDSYLARLQGSKTYQRRQLVTYQAKYMDGKHGYYSTSSSIAFRANAASGTTQNLVVKAYAKTYVTVIVDNGTRVSHKIQTGSTATFNNIAVHSNATIYVAPESLIQSITPIDEINNSTFSAAGAEKLSEVILGNANSENTAWGANTGLNIPSAVLKTLSIRNLVNFSNSLDLSPNVELESVDTRGTNAGDITLPSYAPLTDINLNACSGIQAANLNAVETFTMSSGENLTSVRIENCNSVLCNAMQTYIAAATSAGGASTRRIRMTGLDWTVSDIQFLKDIAENWGGYNVLGGAIDTPVLEGTVHVQTIRQRDYEYLTSVWDNLTIDYRTLVTEYKITYLNYDNTELGIDYVQAGYSIADPIISGLFATPTKPSSLSEDYTFSGWDNPLSGAVWENKTFTAKFDASARTYAVQFVVIDGNDEETVSYSTTGEYGDTVAWDGASTPTTEASSQSVFPIFSHWNCGEGNYDLRESIEITSELATPFMSTGVIKLEARFSQCSLPPMVADKSQYDYLWTNDPEYTSAYSLEGLYAICMSEQYKDYLSYGDKIRILLKETGGITDKVILYSVQGFNHCEKANSPIDDTRDITETKRAWAKAATNEPLESAVVIGGTTYTTDSEEYRVAMFRKQYISHVLFGCVDVYNAGCAMHSGNTNVGGYAQSQLATYIDNTIVPTMPDMLRSMITPVKVRSNGGKNAPTTITTRVCTLFPFNYTEVGFGATSPYVDEISDYAETDTLPVYSSAAARIKKQFNLTGTGSAVNWWLRSPITGNTTNYYIVNTYGISFSNYANHGYALALGFCMG